VDRHIHGVSTEDVAAIIRLYAKTAAQPNPATVKFAQQPKARHSQVT